MAGYQVWIEAARPKTLPAAVTPVLLASATAFADGFFELIPAVLCLAFALVIQIGTNFANDYLDGVRGSDTEKRLGPTRAVAAGLIRPGTMCSAAILVLGTGFCLGLGLIPFGGPWLLAVGVAAVVFAWLYTGGPFPLAYLGLGDVFVVLFFGFVATGCTYFVQAGSIPFHVWVLGLGCGLLVNNLLVVNNYRDVEEDRASDKRTMVVRMGRSWALVQYLLSALFAGAVAVWFWSLGYGVWVLAALGPAGVCLWLARRLVRAKESAEFGRILRGVGVMVGSYGLLFSAALVLGALL